jgi:hypothetical protein
MGCKSSSSLYKKITTICGQRPPRSTYRIQFGIQSYGTRGAFEHSQITQQNVSKPPARALAAECYPVLTEDDRLLASAYGPVAQVDRAAVS